MMMWICLSYVRPVFYQHTHNGCIELMASSYRALLTAIDWQTSSTASIGGGFVDEAWAIFAYDLATHVFT
jgi:hypothetical protein